MVFPDAPNNGPNNTPLGATATLTATEDDPSEAFQVESGARASSRRSSASPDASSSSATASDSFFSVAEGAQAPVVESPVQAGCSPTLVVQDPALDPPLSGGAQTSQSDPEIPSANNSFFPQTPFFPEGVNTNFANNGPASAQNVGAVINKSTNDALASLATSQSRLTVFTGMESALDSPPSTEPTTDTTPVEEEKQKRETNGTCPKRLTTPEHAATSFFVPPEESPCAVEHSNPLTRDTLKRLAAGEGSLVTVEVLAAFAPLCTRSGAQVFADLATQNRKLFGFFKTLKAESAARESTAGNAREPMLAEQNRADDSADGEWENDNDAEWESSPTTESEDEAGNGDVFSESRALWSQLPKLRQSKVKERVFAVAATLLEQLTSAEAAAFAEDSKNTIEKPVGKATDKNTHNSILPAHSRRASTLMEVQQSPAPRAALSGSSRKAAGLFTENFDWNQLTPALQAIYDHQGHRQEVIDGKTFWTFITRCTISPPQDPGHGPGLAQPSAPKTKPSLEGTPRRTARIIRNQNYDGPVIQDMDADGASNPSGLAYQRPQNSNVNCQGVEDESDDEDDEDGQGGSYNADQLQELMEALLKNMPSRPDEIKREGECDDGTEDPEEERRIQAFTQLLLMQMGIQPDGEGPVAHGPVDEEMERELKLRHLVQERRRDPAKQHLADIWEDLLREEGDEKNQRDGLEDAGEHNSYAFEPRSYTGLRLREKLRSLKQRVLKRRCQNELQCHQALKEENYRSETAL